MGVVLYQQKWWGPCLQVTFSLRTQGHFSLVIKLFLSKQDTIITDLLCFPVTSLTINRLKLAEAGIDFSVNTCWVT